MSSEAGTAGVALRSRAGAWVVGAAVLGSTVAQLDASVVNVALPALGDDLGADVSDLQWVLDGYLLTLASLILLAGALGDRIGRRRTYVVGVAWFTVASLLCALAPSAGLLIAARVLQGVGAALLTPESLAIIEASLRKPDRPTAIGLWAALGGVGVAVGPVLGGWLIDVGSWRWVFLINLPIGAVAIAATLLRVPESRDPSAEGSPDWAGAALSVLGLGGLTLALIEAGGDRPRWLVATAGTLGAAALAGLVLRQRRAAHPLLPPDMLRSRQLVVANAITFVVYTALGGVLFLLVVVLQNALGLSAVAAGAATLPITVLMLGLSSPSGALARRIGPRLQLTVGPLLLAAGMALLSRLGADGSYLSDVLPALMVFGLGLAATVAPITSVALAAAAPEHAASASGLNNAVARSGQLLAVAVLPLAAGLTAGEYADPEALAAGFRTAMLVAAGLAAAGGALGALLVRGNVLAEDEAA